MVELVELIADSAALRTIVIDTLTLNHKAYVPVGFTPSEVRIGHYKIIKE